MHIVTNFERFPETWSARSGERGTASYAATIDSMRRQARDGSLLLINCDVNLTLKLAAWYTAQPWRRRPLVAVDLVLRRPETAWSRAGLPLKRFLLGRVDHFVHYFKDLREYNRYFGIGPERSSFVPFKPNLRYRLEVTPDPGGEYVLCFGRSRRDYDTFFDAIERLPYPAAIPRPDFGQLRKHGSRFSRTLDRLPDNVRLLDDDGSTESLARAVGGARLVVLPILRSNLVAGIATYLNAMFLHKCVIVTQGAGASDVLDNQAIFVPPEDADALASAIRSAWEDDARRMRTADAGYAYARGLGGEPELRQRILDAVVEWARGAKQFC